MPFSLASAGYFIFLSRYSLRASVPPGNSGISSISDRASSLEEIVTITASFCFVFTVSFTVRGAGITVGFTTVLSAEGIFSATFVSTIAVKSLTLTAEISAAFSEISGRAKAVTVMAANGSTYRYFKRAHGLDFSFNIIVIRFLSVL